MRQLAMAILLAALASAAQTSPQSTDVQGRAQATGATAKSAIEIPAGTTVSLALTRPIMAKTAKAGDSIYAETDFPVAMNNQLAIPAGTYVEGQLDTVTRPGRLSPHAQIQIHFTKVILANDYTVDLAAPQQSRTGPPLVSADDVIAAVTSAYVQVSSRSDVLLDSGSEIQMILQVPLRLDAEAVATALRQSHTAPPDQSEPVSPCRPTPGRAGTPDTVIPGTPGTPGTPPTVIPGAPGMPPTIIPGTPGTPGTPDTTVPGSPSTPGVPCPSPPIVTSNLKVQNYRESLQLDAPVQVSGKPLSAGRYQVSWRGSGLLTPVDVMQNGNLVVRVPARVVLLNRKSPIYASGTRTNPDGSLSLDSLRFAGETYALYFD